MLKNFSKLGLVSSGIYVLVVIAALAFTILEKAALSCVPLIMLGFPWSLLLGLILGSFKKILGLVATGNLYRTLFVAAIIVNTWLFYKLGKLLEPPK